MIYKRVPFKYVAHQVVRKDITVLLNIKGMNPIRFLRAFDYFEQHPERFDGATFVKDLNDVPGIDLSAMVHDYEYIEILPMYNGIGWLRYKIASDFRYGKHMELLGKGAIMPYTRVALLWLSTPLYPLWKLIRNL